MSGKHVVWIYRRQDHKFDWRRVAGNGEIVSTSGGQGYDHEDECILMAREMNPGVEVRHFPLGGEE